MSERTRILALVAASLILDNERGTRHYYKAKTRKANAAKRKKRKLAQASKRRNRR